MFSSPNVKKTELAIPQFLANSTVFESHPSVYFVSYIYSLMNSISKFPDLAVSDHSFQNLFQQYSQDFIFTIMTSHVKLPVLDSCPSM
jgi:hypothetical protein